MHPNPRGIQTTSGPHETGGTQGGKPFAHRKNRAETRATLTFTAQEGMDLGKIFTATVFLACNCAFAFFLFKIVPVVMTGHDPSLVRTIIYSILGTGLMQVTMHFTGLGAAPTGKFAKGAFAIPVGLPVGLAWWTMEQPAFLVSVVSLLVFFDGGERFHPGVVFVCMFATHYLQRAYIYPWLSRGQPYPLHAWSMALLFCAANGTAQANELLYGSMRDAPLSVLYAPNAILGYALFAFGMAANIHSDYILRTLRQPGETAYKIPRGGLFEYVSGAHFVGEIIEWIGFATATGFVSAPAAFAAFNVMGIGTRAIATHEWSVSYFGDKYPQGRKRLIPLVW